MITEEQKKRLIKKFKKPNFKLTLLVVIDKDGEIYYSRNIGVDRLRHVYIIDLCILREKLGYSTCTKGYERYRKRFRENAVRGNFVCIDESKRNTKEGWELVLNGDYMPEWFERQYNHLVEKAWNKCKLVLIED